MAWLWRAACVETHRSPAKSAAIAARSSALLRSQHKGGWRGQSNLIFEVVDIACTADCETVRAALRAKEATASTSATVCVQAGFDRTAECCGSGDKRNRGNGGAIGNNLQRYRVQKIRAGSGVARRVDREVDIENIRIGGSAIAKGVGGSEAVAAATVWPDRVRLRLSSEGKQNKSG